MIYKQALLRSGITYMMTWIDMSKQFDVGSCISLKGDNTRWIVERLYDVTKERGDINRDWHVGGL